MRFRLALTLDVRREPPEDAPDRETDLSASDYNDTGSNS